MNGLRRKFVNPNLANKTCRICKKEYPRNDQFFYVNKRDSAKRLNVIIYFSYCIRCDNEITIKWKKDNAQKKRQDARNTMSDGKNKSQKTEF